MKGEPKHFYCLDHETGNYNSCNKEFICENGLSREDGEYRPETEDYFYIDNWQNNADILCESKSRIGFIGACFFIGVLIVSTIITLGFLSDILGRKWIFVGSICFLMLACFGFLFATTIEELYIYMLLYGITFPGRLIVGQNFAYEFLTPKWQEYYQPIGQYVQGVCVIILAFYF
jgi:MFS family permease